MRILISNDDGIYSPGIVALAEVAAEFGHVRVVAPNVEQSSMGHAITASRPLSYHRAAVKDFTAFAVNGTPADCVSLGAHHWEKVDWVLSGCNLGLNLGNAIWHSGTLAAAKQAALLGLRGAALSVPTGGQEPDFETLKPWIRRVLETLFADSTLQLVNVNFPHVPRGLMWTRAEVRHYDGFIVPTRHPSGRELFWFTVKPLEPAEEGTDRWAMEQGWVSITPLRLDLTDEKGLADVKARRPLDEAMAAVSADSPPASPETARSVRDAEAAVSLERAVVDPSVEPITTSD